jgi:hypothetical protein
MALLVKVKKFVLLFVSSIYYTPIKPDMKPIVNEKANNAAHIQAITNRVFSYHLSKTHSRRISALLI